MIRSDYHMHTNYCDGKNTPEEMVLAAIEKGMTDIGISGHGYTSFDDEWCMSIAGTKSYVNDIKRLKDRYSDRINIHLGAEWDIYCDGDKGEFEYVVGSVHYVKKQRGLTVDESAKHLTDIVKEVYNGDIYALCEDYYANVKRIIDMTDAAIIGHFDLVTKFNEDGAMIDTHNKRYVDAWMEACDELLKAGRPFEINTGAITRGYRNTPYPSDEIIDHIGTHGGSFILSSDSHSASSLMYGFDDIEKKLNEKGYKLVSKIL